MPPVMLFSAYTLGGNPRLSVQPQLGAAWTQLMEPEVQVWPIMERQPRPIWPGHSS